MDKQKSIRVLVAEDDFLLSQEIARSLEKIGYEQVGSASNGAEAVELARSLHPDVILMDIKMPKLDGLEATRRIQEDTPTPVVLLTAYESRDLVEKAGEAGVAAYLTKPPKSAEIKRAVTIALARHNDLMELRRLNRELENALAELKTLRGVIPICANCKKIRDDQGYWQQIEAYIRDHSEADFTHGICPDCSKELYPDLYGDD